MVTVSRTEYESQQAQLTELKLQNQWLLEQLGLTKKRQSGSVRDIVPEGTPTEVVEHRLSEEECTCEACGAVMEEIGREVYRSLQMEPARFWIREDAYYTYACRNCEEESDEADIRKTPKQLVLCPGSFASAEAVAHITLRRGFSCRLRGNSPSGPEIRDVFPAVPFGAEI